MKFPEDPFIRELLPEFVDDWLNNLQEIFLPALESRNADDLYRVGHTLKGSCFQFGLDEVAGLGITLMEYSKAQDWEKASSLYAEVKTLFEDAKIELDNNPI